MRSLALTLAATFSVACAFPSPTWTEVRSRHFVLQTDVGLSQAEDIMRDLESSYAALRSCVSPGGADPPGMTEVVAFDNEEDYRKLAPRAAAAHFAWRTSLVESTKKIVFPATAELHARSRQEIVQHELTHRFVAHYMPNVPLWFNEGMAEFLSTAHLDGDAVVMGEPPSLHWLSGSGWMVDRRRLVELAPEPAHVREHTRARLDWGEYLGAWMLVHVMVLGEPRHRQALEGYLNDLRTGDRSEAEAMAAHLDAKTLSEIDAAYVAFQTRTITPVQALALDAPPTLDVASRSVPPAEALAMRSRVWRLTRSQQMLALGDANTAISLDPKSPEGYLARASVLSLVGNPRASIQDLRTALRLSPADSRVRRGLGSVLLALEGPTTEVKGLVEWVRPRATSAEDFRFLATWELRMRHPERSLELATKGVSLDIGCIACYELAAEAASRTGDRKGAVRFQHQAVNIAAEGANPKMLERLAILENALKAPAPAKNLSPDAEKEAMVAAVRARRPEFDACYEPARAKTPTLRGKVNVFFVVRADGAVTDVKSHGSTLPDAGVVACVLDRIRIQKFDAPAKGARALRITFVFPKKADGSSEDPAPEPTAP